MHMIPGNEAVTFVVATNSHSVLHSNFMVSPCLVGDNEHEILIREGYRSAAAAYNGALEIAKNDLIVFAHQDMIFPRRWISDLHQALAQLASRDPEWGVLGVGGVEKAYVYSTGLGIIGEPFDEPYPVRTLDEMVLVFRRSSGLRFDDELPHYHMYGPDICLQAESMGRTNYAVSAFCVHNSQPNICLPPEFYRCYNYVRRKWRDRLPILTTCIEVTRWNTRMYERKCRDAYFRYIRPKTYGVRDDNGRRLLKDLEADLAGSSTGSE